jgi:hypothetical protein
MFGKKKKVELHDTARLNEFGHAYMEMRKKISEMMDKKEATEIRQIMELIEEVDAKNSWIAVFRVREFIKSTAIESLKKKTPQITSAEVDREQTMITEEDLKKAKEAVL